MFGGNPFGNPFQQMHRQMQEMDNMMNAVMGDMFAPMFGHRRGAQQPMIGNGSAQQQNSSEMMLSPFGGFGGGLFGGFDGIMQQMNNIQNHAMNDPNSTVFTHSTMISYDGTGQPRVVQSSTRKAGDVKETRHSDQRGAEARMTVGHQIGDRSHIIEKHRDKRGRVRQNQQFINLDEDEAEDFNNEFKAKVTRNLFNGGTSRVQQAIQNGPGSSSSKDKRRIDINMRDSNAPIVTIPDDEEDERTYRTRRSNNRTKQNRYIVEEEDDDEEEEENDVEYVQSSHTSGPRIREITDDEPESHQHGAKRRKGLFGKFLGGSD